MSLNILEGDKMAKKGFTLARHPEFTPACWRACEPYKVGSSERVSGSKILKRVQNDKVKGFTLAEVLITLAIIGVVAALTIPTVVRNYQERQTVTALKKFYSQISQAFKLAEIENGALSTWDWGTSSYNNEVSANIYKLIAPHLKILKYCDTAQKGCFGTYYKQLNGEPWDAGSGAAVDWAGRAKARLADGMSFWIANYTNEACATTQGCGELFVDLNGDKAPNTLGRDTFLFSVMGNGTIRPWSGTSCSKTCTEWAAGYGCAGWVLKQGNMDYLHKEISW